MDAPVPEPLLRQRFGALTRHLAGVRVGDPRAVHQARVATRRLREALALVPARRRKRKARDAVRALTQALGPVREIDVMLATLDNLARSTALSPGAARVLRLALQRDRRRQHRKALNAIEAIDLSRVRRKLLGDVPAVSSESTFAPAPASAMNRSAGLKPRPTAPPPMRREERAAARQRAARRARALRAAIDEAAGLYVAERLHDVRIAVKKLRYALEVVAATRPGASLSSPARAGRPAPSARTATIATQLATLKRAQEQLGQMHDFEVLIGRIRALQGTADAPDLRVSGDLDRLVRTLETECRLLHAHYMTLRPQLIAIAEKVGAR